MKIINTASLTPESMPSTQTEQLWIYNGLDCCVTAEVLEALLPQLTPETQNIYNLSRALQGPILEMNMRGVLIDEDRRQSLLRIYREEVNIISSQLNRIIREGIGWQFEIGKTRKYPWPSNAQLQTLFYDVMGIAEITKRNPEGDRVRTVDRTALEKLEAYFYAEPIVRHLYLLREHAERISFLNTTVDADGRLRTSFNIAGTTTGRLASSFSDFGTGTNLQNVENRLRACFIADIFASPATFILVSLAFVLINSLGLTILRETGTLPMAIFIVILASAMLLSVSVMAQIIKASLLKWPKPPTSTSEI